MTAADALPTVAECVVWCVRFAIPFVLCAAVTVWWFRRDGAQ